MSEHQHLEWKLSWRDDYLKWICGFANAEGGVLVIGRNDAGVAVGVKNARRLLEEIPNKVRDLLGIMMAVNLCWENGLWVEFPFALQGEAETREKTREITREITREKTSRLGEKLGERLGETRAAIVRAMLANPWVTTAQLAHTLNISTTAVEKNIKFLKNWGEIERIGPARGGHWKVLP